MHRVQRIVDVYVDDILSVIVQIGRGNMVYGFEVSKLFKLETMDKRKDSRFSKNHVHNNHVLLI